MGWMAERHMAMLSNSSALSQRRHPYFARDRTTKRKRILATPLSMENSRKTWRPHISAAS
jgi:hypothetical protein